MKTCNSTLDHTLIAEEPLWQNGHLTFHYLGLYISAGFALLSLIISLFLILMHATHYLRPWEQKHIIRILLMVPVYALVSWLSYAYYRYALYFKVLRDCYEAFAIASFFTLMCAYVAPTLREQKDFFRGREVKNWFWRCLGLQFVTTGGRTDKGPFRRPRSGLTWFNIIWAGVFQYCVVKVLLTIVTVITEAAGDHYCQHKLSPHFAHLWVTIFSILSVFVAMYCLVQFYIELRQDIAEYKPFMKITCIKLVVFFSFWQSTIIGFLSSEHGPLKPTSKINYPDIFVGVPSILLCIEMAIFAVLHLFAFNWKPYTMAQAMSILKAPGSGWSGETPKYKGGFMGWRALVDSFNPWDIIKAIARGFRWVFIGVRERHHDAGHGDVESAGGSSEEDTKVESVVVAAKETSGKV